MTTKEKILKESWKEILSKDANFHNQYVCVEASKLEGILSTSLDTAFEAGKEEIQSDINSVLNMLDGDTDRKKIANYIREYLVK
jgi:hypothetical protein